MSAVKTILIVFLAILVAYFWRFPPRQNCDCPTTANPPATSGLISETPPATPTIVPADVLATSDEEKVVYMVNNVYACQMTDRSEFNLDKNYFVTKIQTWYSWDTDESEVSYEVLKENKAIASGKMLRKECDPYQKQWCIAIDSEFNRNLDKGDYVLKLAKAKICQNTQSSNKGFIFVYARPGSLTL